MRSGRLDRRIKLQRKTVVENSYGEPIETWVDLATVWAEYLPARSVERYAATQMMAEVDTRWRIRYRTDLTPIDRLSYAGRLYDVTGVVEMGRREGLEIYSKARAE
ncbi:MAG TPA: phage head closure protein [Acidobacteriota bacterium]|nr:phage head closure protein [Acidobacteriota bacterium]